MNKITKPQQEIENDHHEDHIYVYEDQAKEAVNAALLINRPLLILGEPGIGKSQLAKAVACELDRTYIPCMVNANTEAQDLLWSFDGVARLAEAQIEGALCNTEEARKKAREQLDVKNFIKPAPLWMALNWESAKKQYDDIKENSKINISNNPMQHYNNAEKALENGVVLLIDEIDKANSSVPNGLLEVLGANRFHPDGFEEAIEGNNVTEGEKNNKAINPPLIIITTNQERTLPDAFLRRCLSVTLGLPKGTQNQIDYLVNHAKPNFPKLNIALDESENKTILQATAKMVIHDREEAEKQSLQPLPGQAEYFDLLRGINKTLSLREDHKNIAELIENLAQFTSKKHPDFKA